MPNSAPSSSKILNGVAACAILGGVVTFMLWLTSAEYSSNSLLPGLGAFQDKESYTSGLGNKIHTLKLTRKTVAGPLGFLTFNKEDIYVINQLDGQTLYASGNNESSLTLAKDRAIEGCGPLEVVLNTTASDGNGERPAQVLKLEKPEDGCLGKERKG